MDKNILHVINRIGQKMVVPFIEKGPLTDDVNDEFFVDEEWYLAHGYVSLEQHRSHLNEQLDRAELVNEIDKFNARR